MKFDRITYSQLSAKQQEIYNFQKVAASLADYGFNCIKLADDWRGADFLAYHKDGNDTLRVQLKGRITVAKQYCGKGLYIVFPVPGGWCLVPHDTLVSLVGRTTGWLNTASWLTRGLYSATRPSKELMVSLQPYIIGNSNRLETEELSPADADFGR
ncbi:MAG: hypothetical protein DCC43_14920 [Candidatus Brocadia sp.]|nr:hypothetical protein [Candidatus Brocadia sp.]RIJ90319.1 MAG: hypothetical protein DCC43_14920 [Candidatus Brocadia sp.]